MGHDIPNEDQISRLYEEMYGCMFAYALSVLQDSHLAEEAVQDTFCILCMKSEQALEKTNPNGWLMRTLQNVIRNMKRQRAAMNRLIMASLQIEDLKEATVYDEEDVDLLYGDVAERSDFKLLKRIVLDNYSMSEAAEEFGITVEACKKRVQRMKGYLKNKLSNFQDKKINVPK